MLQQRGVAGTRQLADLGIPRDVLSRAVRNGHFVEVRRRVLVPAGSVPDTGTRLLQASLTAPAGAIISHMLALEAHGIVRVAPDRPLEYVQTRGRARKQPGVVAHRTRNLPSSDITTVQGEHLATIPERTIYDVADRSSLAALTRYLDDAARLGLFSFLTMYRVLDDRKRVAGRKKLLAALDLFGDNLGRARSELERVAIALCAAHGLPAPVLNAIVAGVETDLSWSWSRGVVELDGFRFHSSAEDVARNARKRRRLRDAGFHVLVLTWHDVSQRPDDTCRRIAAHLERHRI